MIAGIAGADEPRAYRILACMGGEAPGSALSRSTLYDVTVARWSRPGGVPSTFERDHAYVGTMRGGFPGPQTELRGDFACVARVGGRLRLSRARFGGRPLYWARHDGVVVACDRLLPIARVVGRGLRLSVDHLLGLFDTRFWVHEAPLPFAGVSRIDANTLVDVDASGRAVVRRGFVPVEEDLDLDGRDIPAAVRDELSAAVERDCAGKGRVAVFGGGGIDSSNLLAVAVHNARAKERPEVASIAVEYRGPGDDTPHLRAVGRHLGVESTVVPAAAGADRWGDDWVVDASAHSTGPTSTILAMLDRARQAGAELALFGHCSEMLFDDDPAVFASFLLGSPLRAIAHAATFETIGREPPWRSIRRLVVGPIARSLLPAPLLDARQRRLRAAEADRRIPPWAGPRLRAFLSTPRRYPSAPAIYGQRERVMGLASSAELMATREHLSRWEVAGGMPIALPYLDDDFVRFMARVPSAAIFTTGRERGLLREAMRGLVPDGVRRRMDKAEVYVAFADLFTSVGGADAVKDLVPVRALAALGVVDADRFRASFDRFAADPYAAGVADWHSLWEALTAEAYAQWFDAFVADAAAA